MTALPAWPADASRGRRADRAAFTRTEAIVVIAGFALVAFLAVVQIQRARLVIDEQLALRAAREIAKSCQIVSLAQQHYPATLRDLPPSTAPMLETDLLGDGTMAIKHGYMFTYRRLDDGTGFTVSAEPQVPGQTGVRHFFMDQSGRVHERSSGPASNSDPVAP